MRHLVLLLSVVGLLMLSACGGEKKKQAEADDAMTQKETEAMESIVDQIEELYETIAKHPERSLKPFACHTWWDAVEAVEERDAELEEIGFFNDDLWTQMQDTNPDEFEVRDVLFEELDVEEGTALVDFVLWSPIQTVHQKFRLCQEEGDWRVHDIIRIDEYDDGDERQIDMLEEMTHYLAEPFEEFEEEEDDDDEEEAPQDLDGGFRVSYQGEKPGISDFAGSYLTDMIDSDDDCMEGVMLYRDLHQAMKRQAKGLPLADGETLTVDSRNGYLIYEKSEDGYLNRIEMCFWNEADGKHKLFAENRWAFSSGKPIIGQYDGLSFYRYDNATKMMTPYYMSGLDVGTGTRTYTLPRTGKDIVATIWNDNGTTSQTTLRWDGQKFY